MYFIDMRMCHLLCIILSMAFIYDFLSDSTMRTSFLMSNVERIAVFGHNFCGYLEVNWV